MNQSNIDTTQSSGNMFTNALSGAYNSVHQTVSGVLSQATNEADSIKKKLTSSSSSSSVGESPSVGRTLAPLSGGRKSRKMRKSKKNKKMKKSKKMKKHSNKKSGKKRRTKKGSRRR